MNDASVDLLLTAGRVLTLDEQNREFSDGAVAIKGSEIVAVGPAAELAARWPQAPRLDTPHGLLLPGLINSHTHVAMSCFRGLADDLPLMSWLTEHIFPAEAKLTEEIVYHSSLLTMAEMIRSGTTSFCDMYLFTAQVAAAAADSGMRAWVGEVLYDFPSPCYGELENGFQYLEQLMAEYDGHELVKITVDPHAVYTCSPELLRRLYGRAEKHDALYHIHLAETRDEVAGCLEKYGKRPVAHLDALGVLGERTVAAHGVWLEPAEIELLARRGVKVAHCPESNMKLASGISPVPELLAAGVSVGLGTDGAASNNDIDLFGEMDMAAKLHKVNKMDPTVLPAAQVLRMATRQGAEVLGAGAAIGSLEPGKKADCIVIDLQQPHLTPFYHAPSQLVYAARGADVLHTVINGRLVMENRRLLTIDEEALTLKMQEIQARMAEKTT
ncbi:amidohydrolase [Desulfurivibrio alkaliphilus]|uniref:5-methylthioadenosine/S-adenosylhomocysteine deaminase n=1 Tax=Desulfurivibrio alkaliphilus (strain DSM 19089 / UNIQEM U267 / AHT2) TaxID=589865 RepID=D6Z195_DESAT|nr:amidohydrolase [Desulfurivibrio alkaliphilus]ADH85350.1 amidohydrolase [Desulfurivibrio alkaliphilus AHT 2]